MRQRANTAQFKEGEVFTDENGYLWLVLANHDGDFLPWADLTEQEICAAAVGIAHPEAGQVKHLHRIFIDPEKSIFKNIELFKHY